MEYLLGSIVTLVCVYVIQKTIYNKTKNLKIGIRYSQSSIYELMVNIRPDLMLPKPKPITQSYKHNSKNTLRILYMEGKAYWLINGVLHTADAHKQNINEESVKVVDMFTVDSVELDKMAFIVQQLTDGK